MDEHRRRLLALLGTAGATPLAGCGFFDDGDITREDAKLAAEDGDSLDFFGGSVGVSSDGTTAVIGAYNDEDPNGGRGFMGAGSAYVFQRESGEWREETKLAPEDGNREDEFGESVGVSSDGTTAVIGASQTDGDQGAAYVFKREGGEWREERKLAPEDRVEDDYFGQSVGVSDNGTTAVIGAPLEDPNGEADEYLGGAGSAYVFKREGGGWREETKLAAGDGDTKDRFGSSVRVSSDGTTAVIGATTDDDPNGEDAGSAYVFKREGGAWREEQKLAPEDGDSEDNFGIAVGVSSDGTTAVIGAWRDEDPNGTTDEPVGGAGSANVFQREDGAWSEETKLAPEDGNSRDNFGVSVGVSGDGTTAIIGARDDEDPNGTNAGSAYVFQRESGEWREERKLTPGDGDNEDKFGHSVGVSSDGATAVIGASQDEDPNRDDAGSAYVFKREGGDWSEATKLAPEDGNSDDFFGHSVEVSSDGTTAVIGADGDEDPNGEDAGSAHVFTREGGEWHEETKLAPEDGDENDRFGSSIGVSSDGMTAVIGARFDDAPNGERAGSAYVFTREGGEWPEETKLAPEDGNSEDNFGGAVGVSSDGATAVIGAPLNENPNGDSAGSAYVFPLGE